MVVSSGKSTFLPLLIATLFLTSACGSAIAGVGFRPPFSPVTFFINTDGTISIQGDLSIETPVGEVVIEASASSALQPEDNTLLSKKDNDSLLVIIRHKQKGSVVDDGYKIQTGQDEIKIVTDGKVTTDITQHEFFIDASKGTVQSITVKDANSTTASTSPVADTPRPTPTPDLHGLTVTRAANLLIHFYDEKSFHKGSYLMKDITSMTLPQPPDAQMQSCVDATYETSFLYSPETVQETDENAFTLQLSGSSWTVVSMDGCMSASSTKTIPHPQTPSAAPPTYNQALPLIKPYFDNSPYWSTGWVLYSVQGLTFRQQVGEHIGACIFYSYAYYADPNTPVGTDKRKFGFEYINGTWQIDSVDNSYPMGHSSC